MKKMQNETNEKKIIGNKLEAWLLFFSDDSPETVLQLSEDYPEFRKMYEEGYQLCRNIERVMDMFSKELQQLDRNTVQLMIDEMQENLNQRTHQLEEQKDQIREQQRLLREEKCARNRTVRRCYQRVKDVTAVAEIMEMEVDEVERILKDE